MNRRALFMAGLVLPGVLLAQPNVVENEVVTTNWSDVAAGGGRLFFALVAGILLALAFQWILTCLSLATGASALGGANKKREKRPFYREDRYRDDRYRSSEYRESSSERKGRERAEEHETEWEAPATKLETAAGIWALVTTALSVFFASWLAAELIRFGGRAEAVIMGLTVWAGFMFTMMRLEASMLGSMISGLTGALKGGLQTVMAPVKSAAGALASSTGSSAEEIAAKVREEFGAQGGGAGIKDKLKEYVGKMPSPSFERSQIENDVEDLFEDQDIREAAKVSGNAVDRRRFQEIVASRGDLPPDDQRMLTDTLYSRWNRTVQESRSEGALSHAEAYSGARPMETRSSESRVLETSPGAETPVLKGETTIRSSSAGPYAPASASAMSSGPRTSGTTGLSPSGFTSRFQSFKDFLRNSDKRDLNPVRIEQEVESLLIHPEEGLANMEKSAREMNREESVQALRNRRDITLQEADSIADLIDAARIRLLSKSEIREHRAQESSDKALARIRDWTYSLKRPEMDYEGIKSDIGRMLEDPKAGFESLKGRMSGIDRNALVTAFAEKKGMSKQEAEKLAEQTEQAMKTAEEKAGKIEEETRRRMEALRRTALENAESTRRVAATAAWWLFAIAVVTAIASALGGLTGANT